MISNRRNLAFSYFFTFLLLTGVMTGCGSTVQGTSTTTNSQEKGSIILATTTSTQDSGLLDSIIPAFVQKAGIQVKVVAVGTGQAIQLGKDGNADVLLVHARKSEDEFVASGFGVNAYDVMYNQFLIVGPKDDPAGIKGMATAPEAFKAIAMKKAAFISRGDDSGTHKKELSIWDGAAVKPEDPWYLSAGQGMGATLQMADEKNAYTLTDEATYLSRTANLVVLKEGDASLLNPYGVIQVKSTSKEKEVEQFIQFLVGTEGQKQIGEFGKADYGKGLFVPSAKKR
ncbi:MULTISPECIES: substrate-binding domain-containing protein [unclassified Paenibacillus]|uniref:substrate-binding domain-containing protein n=1 Tax=unclassified Paenibacillus TaxID=185978 RepID=UPI001AE972AD|nr:MULTISPECIES: substrate-binding domain-containing protein [unclassified Paenibacillus]MBP1154937.1 tungstate transport system substrate-binding protein [Paenibacillus sp. PvP091]MBP1169679.1 tungstate transport system substrate-binding protein [Paenibacillus sp. PvR098]MBP2440707.1 tungstate transport system substrate-binding protein [Paenibacillus sp. PvP052]